MERRRSMLTRDQNKHSELSIQCPRSSSSVYSGSNRYQLCHQTRTQVKIVLVVIVIVVSSSMVLSLSRVATCQVTSYRLLETVGTASFLYESLRDSCQNWYVKMCHSQAFLSKYNQIYWDNYNLCGIWGLVSLHTELPARVYAVFHIVY